MKTQTNLPARRVRARLWVGIMTGGRRALFRSLTTPTETTHGAEFICAIGPFRTVRGAEFCRDYGRGNPHCLTVTDAEHLARGEAYDLVLRKYVPTRAAGERAATQPGRIAR